MKIMTVTGPIHPDGLGVTLMHEHVFLDGYWANKNFDSTLYDERIAMEELQLFQGAGGQSLVDATPRGLCGKPARLKAVSEALKMPIVAGCGWYVEAYHPEEVRTHSVPELAELIIRDIEEGLEGTGVRPGVIGEIGTGHQYIAPGEERCMRAAARAHHHSGLAITTHAMYGTIGLKQLEILHEEKVDPRRVIIGHMDTYLDLDYHEAVAKAGAWIEYDAIGRADMYPDRRRAEVIAAMIRRGYLNQILFSQDVCKRSHLHAHGGFGYDHILRKFIPLLAEYGVGEAEVHTIMVENPKRALAY
jgi:predicted metal-dependent phosphotriesterase family hydrolase